MIYDSLGKLRGVCHGTREEVLRGGGCMVKYLSWHLDAKKACLVAVLEGFSSKLQSLKATHASH